MTITLDRSVHRPDWHAAVTADYAPDLQKPVPGPLPAIGHPHAPGLEIVGHDARVPVLGGGLVEYANLDHAASAPALRVVKDAVDAVVERYASVHRGTGFHSALCTRLYEQARQPVREFVGGRPDDAVIFTRNTTDSLNLLAHCLPARTTVVVFETEHHAALLPWGGHRVVRLAAPDTPANAVTAVEKALRTRRPGPALVVLTGASNVTGEVWPVAQIARVARSRGARVALDAAQLAPHRPFSLRQLDVDYVVLSGHKLYAPFGTGALIGRPDWLAAAPPYLIGGGATAAVHTEATVEGAVEVAATFQPLPARHEAGSPNVPGAVALATACHALAQADRAALATTEAALTARLREGLSAISGVTVHTLFAPSAVDAIGVVTFTVLGEPANLVAAALSAEHGIGVRDGAFCAHPLVRRLLGSAGCQDPSAGQAVRASVGLGTTAEHVDRIIAAVTEIAAGGTRATYELIDGRPAPVGDDRALPILTAWQ